MNALSIIIIISISLGVKMELYKRVVVPTVMCGMETSNTRMVERYQPDVMLVCLSKSALLIAAPGQTQGQLSVSILVVQLVGVPKAF